MAKTAVFLLAGVLVISLSSAAPAVVETFNDYPGHANDTTPGGDPLEYWIYGDSPTNDKVVAAWSIEGPGASGSAGIASSGSDKYAFGTGTGNNPGTGEYLAVMDIGMQDWGMTDGVIADYLGPNGRDLHGGFMSVRALLSGFAGKIELGFVSDLVVNYDEGDGDEFDEFGGSIFDTTASFDWYQGMDLNDYTSYYDGTPYVDLPGVKVLGVWVTVISNTTAATVDGELRIDEIQLTPEPSILLMLGAAGLFLLGRRFKKS